MRIFVSYRRAESDALAGQLRATLERDGRHSVFIDTINLPLGYAFPERIEAAIDDADIVLALIGPHWIERTTQPGDWCVRELLRARSNPRGATPIVPVLHGEAKLALPVELLPELEFLRSLSYIRFETTRPTEEEIRALQSRFGLVEQELLKARRTSDTRLGGVLIGLSASIPLPDEFRSPRYNPDTIAGFTRQLCKQLLGRGADLAYAGLPVVKEWTPETSMTFDLTEIAREVRRQPGEGRDRLLNYVRPGIERTADDPTDTFGFRYPDLVSDAPHVVGPAAMTVSLWSMRRSVSEDIGAIVCVGGKAAGYVGRMPGIFEECMLAIERQLPVFIVGEFGGAAGMLTDSLAGIARPELTMRGQLNAQAEQADIAAAGGRALPDYAEVCDELACTTAAVSYSALRRLTGSGWPRLNNGLSDAQNLELASLSSPTRAADLITLGLESLRSTQGGSRS